MKYCAILFFIVFFIFTASGQTPKNVSNFNLNFEKISDPRNLPDDWQQWGSGYKLKIDDTEKKDGSASLLIEPVSGKSGDDFGVAAYKISTGYVGKEIELRGFLKLKDLTDGFAGLFMRIESDGAILKFDNMESRKISGTADWTEYSIK